MTLSAPCLPTLFWLPPWPPGCARCSCLRPPMLFTLSAVTEDIKTTTCSTWYSLCGDCVQGEQETSLLLSAEAASSLTLQKLAPQRCHHDPHCRHQEAGTFLHRMSWAENKAANLKSTCCWTASKQPFAALFQNATHPDPPFPACTSTLIRST